MIASEKGYSAMVDLLIEHGAKMDLYNNVCKAVWCHPESDVLFPSNFVCDLINSVVYRL